jgi:hypothetical protein
MYSDICASLTPFIFLCRLKINHTEIAEEYAFILVNGAVANSSLINGTNYDTLIYSLIIAKKLIRINLLQTGRMSAIQQSVFGH